MPIGRSAVRSLVTVICAGMAAAGPSAIGMTAARAQSGHTGPTSGDVGARTEHRSSAHPRPRRSDGHSAKSAARHRPRTVVRCQGDDTDQVDEIDDGVYTRIIAPGIRCPGLRSAPTALTRTFG